MWACSSKGLDFELVTNHLPLCSLLMQMSYIHRGFKCAQTATHFLTSLYFKPQMDQINWRIYFMNQYWIIIGLLSFAFVCCCLSCTLVFYKICIGVSVSLTLFSYSFFNSPSTSSEQNFDSSLPLKLCMSPTLESCCLSWRFLYMLHALHHTFFKKNYLFYLFILHL